MKNIILLFIVVIMVGCSNNSSVSVGTVGTLARENSNGSPLAVNGAALEQFLKLQDSRDQKSITWMIADGLICAIENGTRVKVFDSNNSNGKTGVVILEGQFGGRSGYVLSNWIKPLK